jgi:hypothetical protein
MDRHANPPTTRTYTVLVDPNKGGTIDLKDDALG